MIGELNPKHGCEVWINQMLEKTIEDCFKKLFNCNKLYYYYWSCECKGEHEEDGCFHQHRLVWLGPCGLINYIRRVQHQCKKLNAPVLGVTCIHSKKQYLEFIETDDDPIFPPASYVWKDYWIGDVNRSTQMICGDRLFITLWNRIRDHAAKQKVRKR
jgi:hypothetical protein